MSNTKYVYRHIDCNGMVFYVGSGNKKRPFTTHSRSEEWKMVAKKGYSVEIIGIFSKKEAKAVERSFINYYGLDNLTNKRSVWVDLPKYYSKAKHILLRIKDENLVKELEDSATQDERSINSQIIVCIKEFLNNRKK